MFGKALKSFVKALSIFLENPRKIIFFKNTNGKAMQDKNQRFEKNFHI
jgi:hypothetical protein